MFTNLEWSIWEAITPLAAIGVLIFSYLFICSLFPSLPKGQPQNEATYGTSSAMIYRGVSYERLPYTATVRKKSQSEETATSVHSQLSIPSSAVRLTYRGVPYIRSR